MNERGWQAHPTAIVETPNVGEGSVIWHWTHVSGAAQIGKRCGIGQGCFIDNLVSMGDDCALQNGVMLYHGVTLESGVFIGPNVVTTNDRLPRIINPDGSRKTPDDWQVGKTLIKRGASVGANSTIRCGVTIGEWAMVGAGSVVTRDVPDHGLVYGNPARLMGFVCHVGHRMRRGTVDGMLVELQCNACAPPTPVYITRAAFGRLR